MRVHSRTHTHTRACIRAHTYARTHTRACHVVQPKEAAFTLVLLHPDPSARPSVAELLDSDMFKNAASALRVRHAMMEAEEAVLETQVN